MADRIDISWVRDRLVSITGLSALRAGEIIREAMENGELTAIAPFVTSRQEISYNYHSDGDRFEEDYEIPQFYWNAVKVGWDDRHLYFIFFHQGLAYLSQKLEIDRNAGTTFLSKHDPLKTLLGEEAAHQVESVPVQSTKSQGGRARTHDWAAAAGALAGHFYIEGRKSHADLTRFVELWFGRERGRSPHQRDVENFVTEALRAFESKIPDG